jgi:CrcB protein
VGGALGALARHGVSELAGEGWSRAVLATLAVNLAGCFVLGLLVAVVLERVPPSPVLRGLLVTGLLGGFTTFSALALEVRDGLADAAYAATAGYVVATLVGGPLAVRLGMLVTGGAGPDAHHAAEEPV